MSKIEVDVQDRDNRANNTTTPTPLEKGAALGGIRTHDTVQFIRVLYPLATQQAETLVCNTIQHKRKANIEQKCYGTDDMQQIMLFLRNNTCVSIYFEEVPLCCLLQVLLAISVIISVYRLSGERP